MSYAAEQHYRLLHQLRETAGDVVLNSIRHPDVEDLVLNPDGRLWQKTRTGGWEHVGKLNELDATTLVQNVASLRDRFINPESPILETTFPIDKHRFTAVFPPIVSAPAFALRVRRKNSTCLDDWETSGIITHRDDPINRTYRVDRFIEEVRGMSHLQVIRHGLRRRRNILQVGPTGSGKTSLADEILADLGLSMPHDRVITIEDTPELYCDVPNSVEMLASGPFTMLDCLRAAMRLRPKRIVVGEVRGAEAHALLKAWNTGHPGGIATVHADDALRGLRRLESLVAESTDAPQQELIAQAVNLVIFIEEDTRIEAGRKVREILAVTGYNPNTRQYEFVSL
jgi:P-type conjugative transfer ATPase TrbB